LIDTIVVSNALRSDELPDRPARSGETSSSVGAVDMAAQPARNNRATDNFVGRREARRAVLSDGDRKRRAQWRPRASWRQLRGADVVARALLFVDRR
jgi:hypothetical protein